MPLKTIICDVAAIDWDVGKERVNQRISYEYLRNEPQLISSSYPYFVRLKEQPYETAGVTVDGYTVVSSMPFASGDAYVDYEDSRIYFYSTEAGKLVKITYYGKGSAIVANDVNRFACFFSTLRDSLTSFLVEASIPVNKKVRIFGGNIVSGSTLSQFKEQVLDFGPAGTYAVSAMTAGFWRKLLIGVDTSSVVVSITEGSEALLEAGTIIPAIPANVVPAAVVTVHDDGTGGTGTIDNIEDSKVQDARTFMS